MGDHGHHDPGGHELEAINTKLLFRLLISLSLVTLLAAIAVIQWFNAQRRELDHRNAVAGSFQLQAHDTKMAEQLQGIDKVAASLAANPAMLQAPPPPSGWIHPDDLVGGGAAAAAPAKPADEHAGHDHGAEQPAPTEEEAPVPVELPGEAPDAGDVEGPGGDGAQPADAPKGDEAKGDEAKDKENQGKDEAAKDKPKDNQGKDEAAKDKQGYE